MVAVVGHGDDEVVIAVPVQIRHRGRLCADGVDLLALRLSGRIADEVELRMFVEAVAVGHRNVHIAVVVDVEAPDALKAALAGDVQVLTAVFKASLCKSLKAAEAPGLFFHGSGLLQKRCLDITNAVCSAHIIAH